MLSPSSVQASMNKNAYEKNQPSDAKKNIKDRPIRQEKGIKSIHITSQNSNYKCIPKFPRSKSQLSRDQKNLNSIQPFNSSHSPQSFDRY